jgi:hypothetical protein
MTIQRRVSAAALPLLFAFGPVLGPSPAAAKPRPPRIFFSAREQAAAPDTVFRCEGRVYAHLRFPDGAKGPQALEGQWFLPDGTLQETTRVTVELPAKGEKRAFLWLQFGDKPPSTMLDDFSLGGDYGQPPSPFQGTWTLKVRANGKPLAESTFPVECR